MALKQNINYIYFKGKHLVTSKSQYQYNHGQFLYFADLDLPQTFEVHFSNRDRGDSKPQVGSNKLVEIPDEYYWSGALMIYAWIYLHTGKDDGETVYEVRIPLAKRAKPTDEEPLPQQQGVIDRTIAELNNAVNVTTENANKTEADKTQVANIKNEVITLKEEIDSTATTVTQKAQEAVNAANASETSAQNSARYENSAHNYSDEAKQYTQSAFESKNIANQKAEVATNASTEAMGYRDEALEAKNQAVQAKQNIVDYRDETKGYRDETLTAKNDAQTIKSDVQSLKTQIDKTATDVEINALDAKSSADLSYRSAISADKASLSASQSADEASDFADSASQSASQAEEFKNQSATNVTHYPKVVDGYWYIWDASKDEYVNTNVDARGTKGDKGDIGETGNGIENTVLNSDYTLTITFTDGTSYTTPSIRGEKGLKGDVGNGIASTVLNNDYTLTINFTDGTQYTTPPIRGKQGEKGDQGETGDSGVYIGTDEPTDENVDVWIDTDGTAENFVNDVQINGTSIVNEGVANIPYGSNDNYGLMKASSTNGIFASGGVLSINNASESDIKGGTEELKPITPNREHMATFYGLSKAAGVDEKNSTLSVGEYTDNAKDAIRGMIGAASDEELSSVKENLNDLESDGVAPSAEQLLSKNTTADAVPYLFRKTGGSGADREYVDAIVGGTVCWNQLCRVGVTTETISGVTITNNNDGSITLNGTAIEAIAKPLAFAFALTKDRVYINLGYKKIGTNRGGFSFGGVAFDSGSGSVWKNATGYPSTRVRIDSNTGDSFTNVTMYPQAFDLTAMFGSTIADHIYSLEQTTAGAGVALFKSLFPKDYYPYNAGELLSVSGLNEHRTVGFNAWDEEWEVGGFTPSDSSPTTGANIRSKNFIPVLENTTYYFKAPTTYTNARVLYYDENKTYLGQAVGYWNLTNNATFTTVAKARYMKFYCGGTTYKNDICINLSDPTKNGTYEPYKAHSYPLDSTLTLRGIPKLVDGMVCFDGDVYDYTGKVTRNTILRAYQSGDESLASAITDGTNTVVYSANASIEQADPYQHLQQCDPNGTEEYVSTGIVPVGHNSFYPENLRAKVEGLPWNFASLIAPTESAYKATRNYTTGALLIVNNVLYKATANIANGGNITVGTNVTATTLAEVIAALS